jgi:hypothetical protein
MPSLSVAGRWSVVGGRPLFLWADAVVSWGRFFRQRMAVEARQSSQSPAIDSIPGAPQSIGDRQSLRPSLHVLQPWRKVGPVNSLGQAVLIRSLPPIKVVGDTGKHRGLLVIAWVQPIRGHGDCCRVN